MKILFLLRELVMFILGFISVLLYAFFWYMPKATVEFFIDEVVVPAKDSHRRWEIERRRKKCDHVWRNGDYGICMNGCGIIKFREDKVVTEFEKLCERSNH